MCTVPDETRRILAGWKGRQAVYDSNKNKNVFIYLQRFPLYISHSYVIKILSLFRRLCDFIVYLILLLLLLLFI